MQTLQPSPLRSLKQDLPAGLVVFLVAVPLCLGIAQASGAPLLSGLLAGIIGGVVVGLLSKSPLSVCGPTAGLAVIVASGIQGLGFRAVLLATVFGGLLQLLLGIFRLGVIAHYFPSAVIKGILAAIGILIAMKQVPHAVGYLRPEAGAPAAPLLERISMGPVALTALCSLAYVAWPRLQRGWLTWIPTPLAAAVLGGVGAALLPRIWAGAALAPSQLVALPRFEGLSSVTAAVITPDVSRWSDPAVWITAVTICIVASIETLLSVEAVDRLDPHKRVSPPNRELVALGVGNVLSGLVGGLPVVSVIVRSSANVQAGGQTQVSTIFHGLLLLMGVLLLSPLLNAVPLAALAVVLIVVGVRQSPLSLWRNTWRAGPTQFIPFAVTVLAVVGTDLLKGTLIGVAVGTFFAIRRQQQNAVVVTHEVDTVTVRFTKDITFLQKAQLKEALREIPDGKRVVLDRSVVDFVDDDIEELLAEFSGNARSRNLTVHEPLPAAALVRRALLVPGAH
ncbi:MAG: SulP family inorganic anion transporter [Deltaproteobacteria bacterium]|nr:SulP family inorganic anion transporter [Deltaproteobacteria bacterium]